ncbi:MAG: nucleotidyl transferase AbiEii/AbiGii toxin family protein [Lachnospiraceae bacterium]|nr:nucleotidyl transferase AbiEii/AbiGii toxin family protein [Lachnospiraceae bacterium]
MDVCDPRTKGGTSLTKCYQLLDRFSEDIDTITNLDMTRRRRYFELVTRSVRRKERKLCGRYFGV